MALSPATTSSRRARNSSSILATSSWGPVSATSPAFWTNVAVHELELFMSAAMWRAIGSGMIPKPSRQPVIAYVLEKPSTTTVRSAMPGSVAMDGLSPS